ncbi:hypothetical protein [Elizabethkingia anophelis]|uniref:hypothetical protein n=1 Tax=Elizabethkingia anophelis TaxID=1117645 RepID=UPI0039863F46
MQINLIEAFIYSIIPTLITIIITEKVKGKIKSNFDAKLEEIKKKHNIETKKFEIEISALKSKENYKFTKLHEKRLEILENIYKKLNLQISELGKYVSPIKFFPENSTYEQNENILQENFINAHNNLVNYYYDNKIYLPKKIISLIDDYFKEISATYDPYAQNHNIIKMGEKPDVKSKKEGNLAYKNIELKVIPLQKEIETNFREMLEI